MSYWRSRAIYFIFWITLLLAIGVLIFSIGKEIRALILSGANSNTDWPIVDATLFLGLATLLLGLIAISAPFITKWTERVMYAPKLKIQFKLATPFCHKTKKRYSPDPSVNPPLWREEPVYNFRFWVKNEGKSSARKCEAVLENIYICENSNPKKLENFSPVNLIWTTGISEQRPPQYIDINPERGYFCNIGHISSRQCQEEIERRDFIDAPGFPSCATSDLRLKLDLIQVFYSQSNCLGPGIRYALEIGIHSENMSYQKVFFYILWSGGWEDKPEEMFKKEIIDIEQKKSFMC